VKLGVVLGTIAVVTIVISSAVALWCRIRSFSARREAGRARPLRVGRSTGADRSSQLSHSTLYYPDPVLLSPSNFDLQTSPAMAYSPYSPYPPDRPQRITRALDTDSQGRRGGTHPDDIGRPERAKEELPAYSLPNPGLPAYTELASSSTLSTGTPAVLERHDHEPNV